MSNLANKTIYSERFNNSGGRVNFRSPISGGGVGGEGDARNPSYTPLYLASFAGVANESSISEMASSFARTQYSDDITGPHGENIVLRCEAIRGNANFGGTLGNYNAAPLDVSQGDEIFARMYNFFPADFCSGRGDFVGDGWGVTKWFRLQWGEAGETTLSRITMQLSNFPLNACATAGSSPVFWGATFEGFTGTGQNQNPASQPVIARDAWHALQMSIYLHPTDGRIRFWLDDFFCGEITGINTLPNGVEFGLRRLTLGDYWNDGPNTDCEMFVQDVIVTKDIPNTVDSEGRPYIHPDTRATDFV